jgi:hypothetical protein
VVRSLRHIENGVWWLGVCESRLLRRDGLESFLNREMVGGCRLQRRADSIDIEILVWKCGVRYWKTRVWFPTERGKRVNASMVNPYSHLTFLYQKKAANRKQ